MVAANGSCRIFRRIRHSRIAIASRAINDAERYRSQVKPYALMYSPNRSAAEARMTAVNASNATSAALSMRVRGASAIAKPNSVTLMAVTASS